MKTTISLLLAAVMSMGMMSAALAATKACKVTITNESMEQGVVVGFSLPLPANQANVIPPASSKVMQLKKRHATFYLHVLEGSNSVERGETIQADMGRDVDCVDGRGFGIVIKSSPTSLPNLTISY